jgi:hypothetical protein
MLVLLKICALYLLRQASFDLEYERARAHAGVADNANASPPSDGNADVCAQQRWEVSAFLERAAGQLEVDLLETNPDSLPGTALYNRFSHGR